MNIKKISLLLCVLLIFSCKREAEKQPDERIQGWLDYYDLSLNDFTEVDQQVIPYRLQQEYDPKAHDIYATFLVYSKDSLQAIDLDSYHLMLKKMEDGSYYSAGRDVDMEVSLIDFEKSIRTRLLFCGPACLFEEASFSPEGRITITGFADDNQGFTPFMWNIDPVSFTVSLSTAHETFLPSKIRYVHDIRLDSVIFRFDAEDYDQVDVPL